MFFRHNLFTIIWAIVILFLSVIPDKTLPSFKLYSLFAIDKLGHIFFYMILSFLMTIGFKKQYQIKRIRYFSKSLSFGISVLYGTMIEIIQGGIIYRNFDYFDIIANIIGCFTGIIIFSLVYYKI